MSRALGLLAAFAVALSLLSSLACDGDPDTSTDDASDSEDTTSTGGMTHDGPTWDNGVAEIFETRCSSCHEWALDYDLVTAETEHLRYKIENGHGDLTQEELIEIGIWFDNGTPR